MLLGLIVRSVSFEFLNKGEFMLADRRYCYRLTITDFASRFLIAWRPTAILSSLDAAPTFIASSSFSQQVIAELARIGEVGHLPTVEVVFSHAVFGEPLEAVGIP